MEVPFDSKNINDFFEILSENYSSKITIEILSENYSSKITIEIFQIMQFLQIPESEILGYVERNGINDSLSEYIYQEIDYPKKNIYLKHLSKKEVCKIFCHIARYLNCNSNNLTYMLLVNDMNADDSDEIIINRSINDIISLRRKQIILDNVYLEIKKNKVKIVCLNIKNLISKDGNIDVNIDVNNINIYDKEEDQVVYVLQIDENNIITNTDTENGEIKLSKYIFVYY